MMSILYLICLVLITGGESITFVPDTKENAVLKNWKTLEHATAFLGGLQRTVKESRQVLGRIDRNVTYENLEGIAYCECTNTTKPITSYLRQLANTSVINDTIGNVGSRRDYLSSAFERLLEQIGVKEDYDMKPIFQHAVNEFDAARKRLVWLGQPMLHVVESMASIALKDLNTLVDTAISMYFKLTHKEETMAADVRNVVDMADRLVQEIDGEHMYKTVDEFKNYPLISKTGKELCRDLLEAFDRPFTKLNGKAELRKLVILSNRILLKNYPSLRPSFRNVSEISPRSS